MERDEAADTALSNLNHGTEEDEAGTRPRRERVVPPEGIAMLAVINSSAALNPLPRSPHPPPRDGGV